MAKIMNAEITKKDNDGREDVKEDGDLKKNIQSQNAEESTSRRNYFLGMVKRSRIERLGND